MNREEPRTSEEYIEHVRAYAENQASEHVPTHEEIIRNYDQSRDVYTRKLEIVLGVIILLIVSFFAIHFLSDSDL